MFTVGAVALAALHELREPYPMTDVSRGDLLDELYATPQVEGRSRTDQLAFVIAAGGEVRR